MKKITLILTCILLSCDNSSLEQKKKRVDELKNSLVEIYTEIDNLEKEISEFDSTFKNKNYSFARILINKSFLLHLVVILILSLLGP